MKTEHCSNCRVSELSEEAPVIPNIKKGSKVLFLLDYPTIEDCDTGRVATGLSKRYAVLHNLMEDTGFDPVIVSYATTIRCITRSKSTLTYPDYEYCSKLILKDLERSEIRAVLCFGSMAARVLTGRGIERIDKLRGEIYDTCIDGITCAVTYALSILTEDSCLGCGKNVYPHLVRKDMKMFKADLHKKRIIE